MSHLVTAIFPDVARAGSVVDELARRGFPVERIGVVSRDEHREAFRAHMGHVNVVDRNAGRGAVAGGVLGALAGGLTAAVLLGIGGVVVAGPIAAAVGAAAAGAAGGSLLGALVGTGIPEPEAREYERYVREGNILLVVETDTLADAEEAERTLAAASPVMGPVSAPGTGGELTGAGARG